MAKILNKVKNFVGWEEEEELDLDKEEEIQSQDFFQDNSKKSQTTNNNKIVNIHAVASQLKVIIMQPENFEDAQEICNYLKERKPTVINLESVEKENAQRVIDFLSGAVYALEGNIQKVANGIFIIAPYNVDILNDLSDELKEKDILNWNK